MFSWNPFYTELATKLLEHKNRRKELVEFVYSSLEPTDYLKMKNGDEIKDIDPFSFYGIFNRGTSDTNRKENLTHIKNHFHITANVPDDFEGIPILNPMKSFFYQWDDENTLSQSCNLLWKIFESGVKGTVTEEELSQFVKLHGVAIAYATMGLFWINPDYYMPMDGNSQNYLENLGINTKKIDANSYLSVLAEIKQKMGTKEIQEQTFAEISHKAFLYGRNKVIDTQGEPQMKNTLAQDLTTLLQKTRNLILHGAPGTGKTHLAKDIAAFMHFEKTYSELTDDEKKQLTEYTGFVQFHPSYDYTDFVEGLRPDNKNDSGQIGFKRVDGVFKKFCDRALKNLIDSSKSALEIEKEKSIDEQINSFISDAIESNKEFEIATGNKFYVTDMTDRTIVISNPANEKTSLIYVSRAELQALLSSEGKIENGNDIRQFFERKWRTQQDSYTIVLYKKIKETKLVRNTDSISKMDRKDFVFIIDEINRGEMSKIFGELFFSIDPGYRGKRGLIQTQYQNLAKKGDSFENGFFIPENVYIIGTMNDIDRSVESMDFAFRRRFTFVEVKAEDNITMLEELDESVRDEATTRMNSLNNAITKIDGLSSAYYIGGAYFLKLNELDGDFGKVWEYHLEGLLREYLRGMENAEDELKKLKEAYDGNSQSINNENDGE